MADPLQRKSKIISRRFMVALGLIIGPREPDCACSSVCVCVCACVYRVVFFFLTGPHFLVLLAKSFVAFLLKWLLTPISFSSVPRLLATYFTTDT